MRNTRRIGVALTVCILLGSCAAGPHQLRRTVDDWDHQVYVNSPWVNAAMWVVPVYPALLLGATAVDFAVVDPYYFWLDDVWDNNGTGFEHHHVEWTNGHVDSLLTDRSGWLRKER